MISSGQRYTSSPPQRASEAKNQGTRVVKTPLKKATPKHSMLFRSVSSVLLPVPQLVRRQPFFTFGGFHINGPSELDPPSELATSNSKRLRKTTRSTTSYVFSDTENESDVIPADLLRKKSSKVSNKVLPSDSLIKGHSCEASTQKKSGRWKGEVGVFSATAPQKSNDLYEETDTAVDKLFKADSVRSASSIKKRADKLSGNTPADGSSTYPVKTIEPVKRKGRKPKALFAQKTCELRSSLRSDDEGQEGYDNDRAIELVVKDHTPSVNILRAPAVSAKPRGNSSNKRYREEEPTEISSTPVDANIVPQSPVRKRVKGIKDGDESQKRETKVAGVLEEVDCGKQKTHGGEASDGVEGQEGKDGVRNEAARSRADDKTKK